MTRRLAVVMSIAATAAVGASAAPAAADQKPTKNGLCGARNMMNENARPHMLEAMAKHTADQGDAGMFAAVARTRCATT